MKIDRLIVGELDTNVYIISINNEVLLIDPGSDASKIIDKIGNKRLVGIIITHYHFDHIGALEILKEKYNVKVYDRNNLNEGLNNIECFNFQVIYTPGHKEDSISIYFSEYNVMFTGDFIFKGTIGRWDLLGGNFLEMKKSIKKMLEYDSNILIYPGHGNYTSLKDEKVNLEKYLKYF